MVKFCNLVDDCLDFFFPTHCVVCGKICESAKFLCSSCLDEIPFRSGRYCPLCGAGIYGKVSNETICTDCQAQRPAFDFAVACAYFSGIPRDLILDLKYQRKIHFARALAQIAHRSILAEKRFNLDLPWLIVPVPLHANRQIWRSFNQAQEIAMFLSREIRWPVYSLLKRISDTTSQTQLERRGRLKNLSHAFRCQKCPPKWKNFPVLLFDDVLTTGATMRECAKCLKNAGFKRIGAMTISRAGE